MSNLTKTQKESGSISTTELFDVLRNSLYPGASDGAIQMVLSYCKVQGLDPMQKPVHIVPMYDRETKRMRDIIMPGIGLYRTQAARTNQYAGISEPEYGPDVTADLDGVTVTFPTTCKVVVRRLLANGTVAEFAATERWLENFATAKQSQAPNAMWLKRPYGQLAKCAEAQALRKAFPEIGALPTFEEMEGKDIGDENNVTVDVSSSKRQSSPAAFNRTESDEQFQNYLNRLVSRAVEINAWEKAYEMLKTRYSGERLDYAVQFLQQKEAEALEMAASTDTSYVAA